MKLQTFICNCLYLIKEIMSLKCIRLKRKDKIKCVICKPVTSVYSLCFRICNKNYSACVIYKSKFYIKTICFLMHCNCKTIPVSSYFFFPHDSVCYRNCIRHFFTNCNNMKQCRP